MGRDLSIPDGAILERRGAGYVLATRNILGGYDVDMHSFVEDVQQAKDYLTRFDAAYRLGWKHCLDAFTRKEK